MSFARALATAAVLLSVAAAASAAAASPLDLVRSFGALGLRGAMPRVGDVGAFLRDEEAARLATRPAFARLDAAPVDDDAATWSWSEAPKAPQAPAQPGTTCFCVCDEATGQWVVISF